MSLLPFRRSSVTGMYVCVLNLRQSKYALFKKTPGCSNRWFGGVVAERVSQAVVNRTVVKALCAQDFKTLKVFLKLSYQ
jgi:hypothetical protein